MPVETETETRGGTLSPAASALLARRRERAESAGPGAITPRAVDIGAVPLSLAQQRLWFLERLDPGGSFYNVPLALRLRGRLTPAVLQRALTEMVRRHEALRSVFPEQDGRPVQVVGAPFVVTLPQERLKGKHKRGASDEHETYVRLRMLEEVRRPFDLVAGPLIRAVLHRLDQRDHLLLVTIHHLVSDAWSSGLFARELGEIYAAFAVGEPSPLADLPIQYADYALWQREGSAVAELDRQLSYWEERLSELESLRLPVDHPRPSTESHRGDRIELTLTESLSGGLKELSRREGVTLFMTVLAAFQALLARASGQVDIAVGAPIAGRTRPETEGLIGFFVNTLVLRTDLSGNPSFREILGRARATALGAYAHQDVPFERLVEALKPARDLGRTPLFQVFLNMRNVGGAPISFGTLQAERLPAHAEGAKFDLSLEVAERPAGLDLAFVFNADLWEPDTVRDLAGYFQSLLEAVVADPDLRLAAVPLPVATTADAEPQPIRPTPGFVRVAAEAIERTIASRFEDQVAATPEALALRAGGEEWSFDDLNRAANRVAHALGEHIAEPGERVALLFDHGRPMFAAVLGVLKAGHAFVPIDPHAPPERVAALLADARPAALLSHGPQLANARAVAGLGVPVIDGDDHAAFGRDDEPGNPRVDVEPTAPAYLLYTSGSTGRPKGVVQSHRNALHHARAYANALGVGPGDRLSLLAPLATDAAVQDTLAALPQGASLHPLDLRSDGVERIAGWLAEERITVYHSTPTVYRHFLDSLGDERFPGVRLVVLGGEPAVRGDIEGFRRHFGPAARLVNGLGPTESTTILQHVVHPEDTLPRMAVPVGRPVVETEVLLLDRVGASINGYGVGEIAVRGEHVALGYWARPDLTAAVFAADPAGAATRTYRTGDLGRRLANGLIEHVGRKDDQVKIRGFRVEPAETEAALRDHPAVREAAVVAQETAPGERRLIAYVVPADAGTPTSDELRRYLRAKLPEPLVPAAVISLDALPLTTSGKLNRRALPAPEAGEGGLSTTFRPPRTPVEETVARVWERVLGVDRVGVDDHFFDLGGHSLLVTQAMARLRDAVGLDLPVRALFEAPTVAELAERVEAARRTGGAEPDGGGVAGSSLVPLQPLGDRRPVFLVPGGAGDAVNLFKMTKLARSLGQERPFYGFFAQEEYDDPDEAPQGWAERVAASYVRELRARQSTGPYILGGTCLGGTIAFEMARQLQAAGDEVLRLFLLDSWRPGARRGFDPAAQASRIKPRNPRRAARETAGERRRPEKQRSSAPEGDALFVRRWRLQRYEARPYAGRIVLFVNNEWHAENPSLGWESLAEGGLDVFVLPGGHGRNLIDNVTTTAERLRECLRDL